ncbi:hypothetical protein Hypma_008116 [Hypsizygus marmoreus]|uniref:HAT C-terminal dimerisation domain-containing protein n=1 Tax=Hypsizygus marmoreus TaxID=39966 RepID=A0A369K3G7_HYPMA|nr:hypothetical protein Hypma_008116 [Hypsizygus marmoreus]
MKNSDILHQMKITESITERAAVIAAELAKELQDAPGHISLMFDEWTSAIMQAYLAVTAHYITDDWVLPAELFTFDELAECHSGENTAEVLYDILDKTKIKEKISPSLLSFHNVTINDKGMHYLGKRLIAEKIPFDAKDHCYEHAVSLAEEKFLNSLLPTKKKLNTKTGESEDIPILSPEAELLDQQLMVRMQRKLKKILQLFCKRATSLLLKSRGFIAKVRFTGLLKQKVSSRSAVYRQRTVMLLKFYPIGIHNFTNHANDSLEVPNVDKDQPLYKSYHFSSEEWDLLFLILEVLEEAANAQEQFSSEIDPSVWWILPTYEYFMSQWHNLADRPDIKPIRHAILLGVKYLEKYYNKSDNSSANILSIYLNPCTKDAYFANHWNFSGQEHACIVMEHTFDKYSAAYAAEYGENWLAFSLSNRLADESVTPKDPCAELAEYLSTPLFPMDPSRKTDILKWWKLNEWCFPILSRMAHNYLAVQGSSVPSECHLLAKTFGAVQTVKARYKHEWRLLEAKELSVREAQKKCWDADDVEAVVLQKTASS